MLTSSAIAYYVSQYYFSFKGQDGLRMAFLEAIEYRQNVQVFSYP